MTGSAASCSLPSDVVGEKVRAIVSRTCGGREVADDQSLAFHLNLDSAGRVELFVAIELAFRVNFSPAEAETMTTVRDLIESVTTKHREADGALRKSIEDFVAAAVAQGQPIDVAGAAIAFSLGQSQRTMTVDDIRRAIEEAATARRAIIADGCRE